MDWVNLLQDGAIVSLAVAQIANSSSIRGLRKRVSALEKEARDRARQGKDVDLPLIDGYLHSPNDAEYRYLTPEGSFTMSRPVDFERRIARGLNPRLFRKGDSVRLSGLQGEFILIGYSWSGFSAVKKASLSDMDKGSSVSVSTTVTFHADRVTAWKRNTGEWPVEWFMGTGNKREEGGSDDHARRVKDRNKKNAAGSSCGSDKRK